jgi:hypothetical protein
VTTIAGRGDFSPICEREASSSQRFQEVNYTNKETHTPPGAGTRMKSGRCFGSLWRREPSKRKQGSRTSGGSSQTTHREWP